MPAVARTPVASDASSGSPTTRAAHNANPVPQSIQQSQIRHLTEVDLARRWRMSERTLQSWRWKKIGPPHVRIVGKVLYRLADIIEFELANLVKADR